MVTGFDGLPQTAWEGYSLTTLVQPIEQLVSASLASLVAHDTSASVIVDGVLRTGRSTNKEATNG
jgi:DNA-binding LacI/PurR family transcriptional regulator